MTPGNEGNAELPGNPQINVEIRFVAFCDILGFSNRIQTNFEETIQLYRSFAAEFSQLVEGDPIEVTIYSDAVLITSKELVPVLRAAQALWFMALMQDLVVRGAVTRGRYWSERSGNHMLVVSDALSRAVKLEKSVGVPAVVLADDIEIPDDLWLYRFRRNLAETPLLHFRDRNIVNPFNPGWLKSAANRAQKLMAGSPAHKDKYLWFLALYQAVLANDYLVPPERLEVFVNDGRLAKRPDHPKE